MIMAECLDLGGVVVCCFPAEELEKCVMDERMGIRLRAL